ncbi:Hypothetical protein R9X50_00496500 [Acrodontium crateriforme]|uniref:Rho GTPase activation protein n=1 Tax=Acrodontium crateriforme TaxID=150365 RepID=A0AAQ3M698_9PEZI|nr:Hypothetical protein R9X50_00496500 [Acrodontium crateriforme]
MRSALAAAAHRRAGRSRASSLSALPPSEFSSDYLPELASIAASILYRSPLPSLAGRPIFILNAAAFPDAFDVDYDALLSYVLARLPGEDELLSGTEYEIIFFAGGQPDGATSGDKKQGPGIGWYLQAYHILSRALRKKLQRLYIVHPRTWVRVLLGVFGTIVSPKFRRKIIHVNTLTALALQIPIETLLIPPSTYLHDRKISPDIDVPYASGRRAFGARHPLPKDINTGETRLPRVLRETTTFLMLSANVTTEGLFRIPPHATISSVLKEAYDRGQNFIVWKEKNATFVQPNMPQSIVDEVRLEDSYGVHSAASLVKMWYRELREPIFPESSYEQVRQRYGNPDMQITAEDVANLVHPASQTSPLQSVNREILTRHLLPMLSMVASHCGQNKMTSENLAIVFSMVLLCGSNQLEDAKMSSIIKRILHASIDMWPQLREGLSIDATAFDKDLQAPSDPRLYEDPLSNGSQFYTYTDEAEVPAEHRIILHDGGEKGVTGVPRETAPALPPRPPRISSHQPLVVDPAVALKRKPAPPLPIDATQTQDHEPPRYSTVFDNDGASLHMAESPTAYVPVDGFGPPRQTTWEPDEKKRSQPPTPSSEVYPTLAVPKRKAISTDQKDCLSLSDTSSALRSASEGTAIPARAAAEAVAAQMAQRMASQTFMIGKDSDTARSLDTITPTADENVFRKPSWPASAVRQPQSTIQSLAKPVLPPPRPSHTVPIINHPFDANNDPRSAPITGPKHRTPSPGLLARMSSMESIPQRRPSSGSLEPKRLNLKKASVDDLRRLYEERASTVLSLAQADAARRKSSAY